jgi:hypothetical protein
MNTTAMNSNSHAVAVNLNEYKMDFTIVDANQDRDYELSEEPILEANLLLNADRITVMSWTSYLKTENPNKRHKGVSVKTLQETIGGTVWTKVYDKFQNVSSRRKGKGFTNHLSPTFKLPKEYLEEQK